MSDEGSEHSRETRHLLNNHIQMTTYQLQVMERNGQERHQAVVASVSKLYTGLCWAAGLLVPIFLSFLGWSLLQQINANEAQKRDLQQQLDRQAQLLELVRSQAPLPAGAAQPADATHSAGQLRDLEDTGP